MSHYARTLVIVAFVYLMGLMACGETDSSDVGGAQGSALAMTGSVMGRTFTPLDAASVVIPATSAVPNPILALIFSDSTGICQQANSTFDPNSTLFFAVMVDTTGSATPSTGTYQVVGDASTNLPSGASGYAQVSAQSQNDSVVADGGQVTIALQDSDTANGTAAGSVSATLGSQEIFSGKFEAPACAPFGDFIRQALGI